MKEEKNDFLMKKWRTQLSKGVLEYLVLTLLQKSRHGWDILQLVRSFLPVTEPPLADGTIYNILTRLKKRELVTERSEIFDGRLRRYFILSVKGIELLAEMKKDWEKIIISFGEADKLAEL